MKPILTCGLIEALFEVPQAGPRFWGLGDFASEG
jgi:hypothetical protein